MGVEGVISCYVLFLLLPRCRVFMDMYFNYFLHLESLAFQCHPLILSIVLFIYLLSSLCRVGAGDLRDWSLIFFFNQLLSLYTLYLVQLCEAICTLQIAMPASVTKFSSACKATPCNLANLIFSICKCFYYFITIFTQLLCKLTK